MARIGESRPLEPQAPQRRIVPCGVTFSRKRLAGSAWWYWSNARCASYSSCWS